jgi:hypothetical protein
MLHYPDKAQNNLRHHEDIFLQWAFSDVLIQILIKILQYFQKVFSWK